MHESMRSTVSQSEGILAVDIGTSAVRATLVDIAGHVLARHDAPTPSVHSPGGKVTLDPHDLWPLVADVIREAVEGRHVLAVGVTAQLGVVLVDDSGAAISPVLLWADSRARHQVARVEDVWRTVEGLPRGRRITGESTAARLAWFAEHEPAVLARTRTVLSLKDWLVFQLTGQRWTDPVHASYSLLFDVPTSRWSENAFRALGLDPSLAPPVLEAHARAGEVHRRASDETGVTAGTPVAVGGPDGTVGSLGAGATKPGQTVDIAGSTDVLVHLIDTPLIDDRSVVTTNAYLTGGTWTIGGATAITGGAVDWLASLTGFDGAAALVARFGADSSIIPPGGHGLMMDTALGGHRFPYWDAERRSGILGASLRTGPAELLAAAREGAAFTVRDGLAELRRLGAHPERITIVGGLARDPLALQLRADVCGIPVLGIGDGLATTRGAAALAGSAAGLYPTLDDAVDAVGIDGRQFEPRTERAAEYDEAHAAWTRAFAN